ncbi:MAG: DivIVA domain-containing protein [Candidatus Atribacteria bacterium]|nr:DivIVA domain-containing protein [Candidatus Atribacteria bacterium]
MRITPMDIEQQQFGRSFRGYNEEEVDNFLDRIAKDYEEVLNENVRLKEDNDRLQSRLEEYSRMDETLRSALLNAQQSASSIKANVQKEAQLLIDDAKIEAEKIKQRAKQEIYSITSEIEELRKRKFLILEKLKNTFKLHIRMLDEEVEEEPMTENSKYMQDKELEDLKMKLYANDEKNVQDVREIENGSGSEEDR